LATDEPFFPSAVRTDFGRCAMVRFLFAEDAAFLMFFFAAVLCFVEATCLPPDFSVVETRDKDLRSMPLVTLCGPVRHLRNTGMTGTICATIHPAIALHPMADDSAIAV
jgi:hypothetical protein